MSQNLDRILIQVIKGLTTNNVEKRETFIGSNRETIRPIIGLLIKKATNEEEEVNQRLLGFQCLLNVSASTSASGLTKEILEFGPDFLHNLVIGLKFTESHADPDEMDKLKLGILVNLSRDVDVCEKLFHVLNEKKLETICDFLSNLQKGDQIKSESIKLLSNLLINLSQLNRSRDYLLEDEEKLSILMEAMFKPWREQTESSQSLKLPNMLLVKNLCLDHRFHEKLVGETVDIIPKLLYPITGPTEKEFEDEEEMNQLPVELQYLSVEKEREADPDIRRCLVDSLLLLCSTPLGRLAMAEANSYLILRELHKREKVESLQTAIEDIVDILMKDETEYEGIDNLREVHVSEELTHKFNKIDQQLSKS